MYSKRVKLMQFLRQKDIIILSSIEWKFQWQRHQIFACFFSQVCNKVIFVESLAKRNPAIRDIPRIDERVIKFVKSSAKRNLLKDKNRIPENLIIISPLVLPSTFNIFRKINRKLFIPMLVKLIKTQGIENPIVLNYLPTQTSLDLIDAFKPSLVIYECVQNFPKFPGVPKDTEMIEKKIILNADLVFTDSDFLYKKIKKIRNDVKRILPGVDFNHFQRADKGRVQKEISTLCYFGGINERRIDFNLLNGIASGGKFEIHMIGPVRSKIPHLSKNVIFSGEVSYQELPKYLKSFDCFILPYKVNEFTKGIIPAKLFECFATGKPIIATPLPSFYEFRDLIYIAHNADEFLDIIKNIKTLENESKYKKRKEIAQKNSWNSRFKEIVIYIENKRVSNTSGIS